MRGGGNVDWKESRVDLCVKRSFSSLRVSLVLKRILTAQCTEKPWTKVLRWPGSRGPGVSIFEDGFAARASWI